ncbi:Hypothetical predicted protein [Podarcis lilfordi]|uniref:C2orf72-like C-terminal domain-containing protein n=1 Tax=Podarcis lilfordi TaxID=74358 RepID=A0AA35P7T2_9SAUR|nr:Hypothetical predicted protein [Podarcis lilfordi]
MDPPPAPHLREFQALVDRAGGRARLLLVGEAREGEPAPRALLETFARDLFAEPEPEPRKEPEAQPDPPAGGARKVFRRRRPAELDTLQAAPYSPGAGQGAAEARAAACRALRAALKLRADGAEAKKQRIPAFLQCIPWARRSRRKEGRSDAAPSSSSEDALQDPEEGVSLTNMEPNGNCEEACGVAAT